MHIPYRERLIANRHLKAMAMKKMQSEAMTAGNASRGDEAAPPRLVHAKSSVN